MLKSKGNEPQVPKRIAFTRFLCKSMLWEEDLPRILQHFFFIASYVQCTAILIWGQMELIVGGNGDSYSAIFREVCKILATRKLIDFDFSQLTRIIILSMLVLYFCLFLAGFGMILKSFILRMNLSRAESLYITMIGQFHLSLGFWISTTILMDYVEILILQKTINSASELPLLMISLILIVFSYIIAFFFSFFSYDPFMTSNVLAGHSVICETSTLLFQGILAPVVSFSTNASVKTWIFTIMSFVVLGVRHYHLADSFPYYHYLTMKISIIFSSVNATITLVSCIALFIKTAIDLTPKVVYIDSVLVPLTMKLTVLYFNYTISKYLAMPVKKLKDKDDAIKKIFSLSGILKNPKLTINIEADREQTELKLWGTLVHEHREKFLKKIKTNFSHSPSVSNMSRKNPTATETCNFYTNVMAKIKKRILAELIDKFKSDNYLKGILAYIAMTYNPTPSASLFHLAGIDNGNNNLGAVGIKLQEKLQKSVDNFFLENRGKILDLQTFIELESISTNFVKMIHSSSEKNARFWVAYCEPQVQVKELNIRSKEIEEEADHIQKLWKLYTNKHKSLVKSLGPVYSMYLSVVRNMPYIAYKIVQKSWNQNMNHLFDEENFDAPLSEDNLSSTNTLTFYGTMSKERPGRISYVSPHVTETLGWQQTEIVGTNIGIVMPSFMREKHDLIISHHLKGGIENSETGKMYQNLETFILEKSGHILPCEVYISIHPTITQIPTYIAVVKVKKTSGDQILLNDIGMIEGFTKNIGKTFGLDLDEKIPLANICNNSMEVEQLIQSLIPAKLGRIKEQSGTFKKQDGRALTVETSVGEITGSLGGRLKLEFCSAHKNKGNINTEIQVYSGRISPYYYCGSCYFVLNLDHEFVKESEDKYQIQTTLVPAPREESEEAEIGDELTREDVVYPLPLFKGSAEYKKKRKPFKRLSTINNETTEGNLLTTSVLAKEDLRTYTLTSQKDIEQILTTMNDNKELIKESEVTSLKKTISKASFTQHFQNPSADVSWKNSNPLGAKRRTMKLMEEFQPHEIDPEWAEQDKKEDAVLKIVGINNRAASSVGSSFKAEMIKIEQAVHLVPKNAKLNILHLIVLFYMIMLGAPLLGYQIYSYNVVSLVQSSVQVLSKSVFRLVRITDAFQYARLLYLTNTGLFESDRYHSLGWTTPLEEDIISGLQTVLVDINQRNNDLRSFVYQLDSGLQDRLYEDDIPVYEMDSYGVMVVNRTAKVFDLTTEVVMNANNLINSGLPYDMKNPYMLFLLNNTYNQLLISSEKTIPILIKDNETKLDTQVQFLLFTMITLALIGCFVLGFFYNIIKKFLADRNQFISILVTLDRNHIQQQINIIQKFASTLEKSNMDGKRLHFDGNLESFMGFGGKKKKDEKLRKKAANMGGLNSILTYLSAALFSLLIVMYSAFPALLAYTNTGNTAILTKMNLLITSNMNLYNINSLVNTIYEYVQENITTYTRNKPIKQDFEDTYQLMTKAQDFVLYELLDTQNGVGSSPMLYSMALGSLCDNIPTDDQNLAKTCKTMGGGACEKGIVGLNSYILAAIKSVKDYFDNSDRSYASMKRALSIQSLIDIEVFYPFTYQAFVWIDNLLKDHLDDDFNGFKDLIIKVVIVYIVAYFLLGTLIWQKIRRTLEKEMAGWRKMMRQIPQTLVVTNKRLRRYLARNSDGILDAR